MTEALRKGRIISESATGVAVTTFYYLLHEGKKYPIPQSYIAKYVLTENSFLQFMLSEGEVVIPETFENKLYRRQ